MLLTLSWLACVCAVYLFLRQKYNYFQKHGIHHLPVVYGLGNMYSWLFRVEHLSATHERLYRTFPNDRFVGQYEFLTPIVVLRDPELIKRCCVKDWECFPHHRQGVDERAEPLFANSLFVLKGQKWRDMRTTLSPAFTGSKMKAMVAFMLECGADMTRSLQHKIQLEGGTMEIDARDLCTRYANDVIASCAFGLKVNSFEDPNNEFHKQGQVASTFTFRQLFSVFIYSSAPWLIRLLKIGIFSPDTVNFFRSLVMNTMKDREQHNISRPDLIHLLMEARKGTLQHEKTKDTTDAGFATVNEANIGDAQKRVWSDDELTAQALIFFLAGFDTVATTSAFLLHELALQPGVQTRLRAEVDAVNARGGLSYDALAGMPYMDMVVSECLRKWPGNIGSDRVCAKAYNLGKAHPDSKNDFIVPKGTGIWLPIWGIHHDPAFYPEPHSFDPERFSAENQHKLNPHAYMPFGAGPRNCIGSRFALMEMKVVTHLLLSQFQVEVCPRTCVPSSLQVDQFTLRLQGGHWLRFVARAPAT